MRPLCSRAAIAIAALCLSTTAFAQKPKGDAELQVLNQHLSRLSMKISLAPSADGAQWMLTWTPVNSTDHFLTAIDALEASTFDGGIMFICRDKSSCLAYVDASRKGDHKQSITALTSPADAAQIAGEFRAVMKAMGLEEEPPPPVVGAPAPEAPLSEHMTYLLGQASTNFKALKGPKTRSTDGTRRWSTSYQITTNKVESPPHLVQHPTQDLPIGYFAILSQPQTQFALIMERSELDFALQKQLKGWKRAEDKPKGVVIFSECGSMQDGRSVIVADSNRMKAIFLLTLQVVKASDKVCAK